MNKLYYVITLAMAVGLMSCGSNNKNNGTSVNVGRPNVVGGQNTTGVGGAGDVWGQVTDSNLQNNIMGLFDPNAVQIGRLDCQGCGVYFKASVPVTYQQVQAGQQVQVPAGTSFALEVWDDMVGQPDPSTPGRTIPQIRITMTQATGVISAQNTQLTFTDQYGSINLQGTIVGDRFQGQMTYNNGQYLGSFQSSVCAIVRCQ